MERLLIAETLKPQGIKGEIKVKLYTDGFFAVKGIKTVYDGDGNEYTVKNFKDATGGFAILSLDGIVTRNDAEFLRGKLFYADKKAIKKDANAFFISDLIGVKVFAGDNEIGVIENITKSNVDIFELSLLSGKKCWFPFLKKLEYVIDLDKKLMTVNQQIFSEVAYYES